MTFVLLFFVLGFCLCSPLTSHHVPLQAEGRIECFRAFISQIFVRHPHTFLSHENAKTSCWLHLFNLILMWRYFLVCFHMSIYPNFDLNFVPHFSQSRDFFTLSGFSSCTCLLCLMTCDLCALSYGHFSHLCFLSRFLTAGLNIVAQIQVWHYFRIGLYLV